MSLTTTQPIFNQYIDESEKEIDSLKKEKDGLQLALSNMQNELENLESQLKESQEEKQFLLLETLQANSKRTPLRIRRSLLITFFATAIALLNPFLNLGLSTEELVLILLPLLVYIVVEGILEIVEQTPKSMLK